MLVNIVEDESRGRKKAETDKAVSLEKMI